MRFKNQGLCLAAMAALGLGLGAGCATKVTRGDAMSDPMLTTDFGPGEFQETASEMVDSLVAFPPIVEATKDRRPVIVVNGIRNKTMQHIDTEAITDSVRTRLIRSGKFRFIDRSTDAASTAEIKVQQDSGLTDPTKQAQFGKQVGAEYMISGSIMEVVQRSGDIKDVYYKIELNLKNIQTGVLEWSDEKSFRKTRQ